MAKTLIERGIIDLHMHGIEGHDTRDADSSLILDIARKQGEAGVSGILLSVYPGPVAAMRDQMAAIERAMGEQSARPQRPHTGSDATKEAVILGVHLEGPFLNPVACGALDPACFLAPDERKFRELVDGFEKIVRTITIAPELPGAVGLIRAITRAGIIANMGHSNATYADAEAAFRAGARGMTHLFNGMRLFHHREPGIAGFGLLNKEVYVEIIGDLIHSSPQTLDLVFKMKDPGRIILVSDSVRETRMTGGEAARDGEGRLLGGSLPLPSAMERLAKTGFDDAVVLKAATENPREYLSL